MTEEQTLKEEICFACNGSGEIEGETCLKCRGYGYILPEGYTQAKLEARKEVLEEEIKFLKMLLNPMLRDKLIKKRIEEEEEVTKVIKNLEIDRESPFFDIDYSDIELIDYVLEDLLEELKSKLGELGK